MVMIKLKLFSLNSFITFLLFISFFIQTNQKPLSKIDYFYSFKLIDGKIVAVSQNGIHFYEKDFKIENRNKRIPFKRLNVDTNKTIAITQYSENDDGYLLILISNILYIFDKNENKIISITLNYKINGSNYSLIPNKKNNNILYFLISYIDKSVFILDNCRYNLIAKKLSIDKKKYYIEYSDLRGGPKCIFMSPQLSLLNINNDILTCFYSTNRDIFSISFDIENNLKEIKSLKYNTQIPEIYDSNIYLNIVSNENNEKALIYIIFDGKPFWLTFDFINKFSDIYQEQLDYNLASDYYKHKMFYSNETNEFIIISSILDCKQLIMIFNNNFHLKSKGIISYNNNNCNIYNYYYLIYDKNNYKMIFKGGYIKSFSDIKFFYNNKKRKLNENYLGDIKCQTSTEESARYSLCTSCNNAQNYYPAEFSKNNLIANGFVECYNSKTKPINTYFDSTENKYKLCYETCHTCERGGTPEENNCLTCASNHIKKPGYPDSTNCVTECSYSYYYTQYGYYRCSNSSNCPDEANLYIRELKKCTNDCSKEEKYKFQYSGECLEKCPENTSPNNNKICTDTSIESCAKSESEIDLHTFLNGGGVDSNAKNYAKEFKYTTKHISIFYNNVYSIIIYKDTNCIDELSIDMPKIDFGNCYIKIQNSIEPKEKIVIALIERSLGKSKTTSYSFYHPETGEKLDSENICKDEEIVVKKNIISQLNNSDTSVDIDSAIYLTQQNIDIFNLSNEFYTDICYHFESPNGKDVPFQDRVHYYYPNLTLCELGCVTQGINFTTMESICQCKINDFMSNDFVSENAFVKETLGEIASLITSSNLLVLTCYKNVFQVEFLLKCTGGFIIIGIFAFELLLTAIFFISDMGNIRQYLYNLTQYYAIYINKDNFQNIDKYINLFGNSKKKSAPPIKRLRRKSAKNVKVKKKYDIGNNIKSKLRKNGTQKNLSKFGNQQMPTKGASILSSGKNVQQKVKIRNALLKSKKKCGNIIIEDYLKPDLNDMEYDDAIKYDERSFCEFFIERLKEKQIIMDTFYHKEKIRPMSIKILLLLLNFDLYFVINGLFFNEEYIIKIYNSENEHFFSYFSRSFNNFVYATLVGIIITIIISCIFIDEGKIKRILLREKEDIMQLKYEITMNVKSIKKRYTIFIILCLFITLISWYYVSCFNYVYPGVKQEWIKSSVTIIVIMQILSLLIILLEAILRNISFQCKSEKVYKVKQFIS